jgi:hypothetical protein
MAEFARPALDALVKRLRDPRGFVQVLAGPRQVGKTTLVKQAIERLGLPSIYETADSAATPGTDWIERHWSRARDLSTGRESALLALDEVHKVPRWSEVVKRLWDEESGRNPKLRVVLLGSSPLLVARGSTESLAGRFELLRLTHWSFAEMRAAFGFDLDTFIARGGYPGAARLADDEERWASYVLDALVETSVSRDVLLMQPVEKPALLRQVFRVACEHSGQVLSFNQMLGQLHDAGNVTTLAHYLDLLSGVGLVTGLQKYSGSNVRRRASSPKLLALNTALMGATTRKPLDELKRDAPRWGRFVESAVGAHLVNSSAGSGVEVFYWREGNVEVDFVLAKRGKCVAIEVKSGRPPTSLPGLDAFQRAFRGSLSLTVGPGGMPLDEFFARPASALL